MAIQDIDLQEYLSGKFFRGVDFEDARFLTIADVTEEDFPQGRKVALAFVGEDKIATLGKQNLRRMVEKFGPRTSQWVGRKVLASAGQEYQGSPSLVLSPQTKAEAEVAAKEDIPF